MGEVTRKIHRPPCWHCGEVVHRTDAHVWLLGMTLLVPKDMSKSAEDCRSLMLNITKHPHTGAKTKVAAFHTTCLGKFIEKAARS